MISDANIDYKVNQHSFLQIRAMKLVLLNEASLQKK